MAVPRIDRVNALLLREIADDLHRVLQSEPEINPAAITVTKVDCAPNLRSADVWVSVMDAADHPTWLRRLSKHAKDFQDLINRNLVLHYTPRLRFRLDVGIAKGDRVLDILSHLDIPEGDAAPDAGTEPAGGDR